MVAIMGSHNGHHHLVWPRNTGYKYDSFPNTQIHKSLINNSRMLKKMKEIPNAPYYFVFVWLLSATLIVFSSSTDSAHTLPPQRKPDQLSGRVGGWILSSTLSHTQQ